MTNDYPRNIALLRLTETSKMTLFSRALLKVRSDIYTRTQFSLIRIQQTKEKLIALTGSIATLFLLGTTHLAAHTQVQIQVQDDPRLISAAEAKTMAAEVGTLVVDVRHEAAFTRLRIPDSINIPTHFLRTKSYLKNCTTILVDEGYENHSLLKIADRLNTKGFNMYVLAGGIAAWHQQKFDLHGDLLQQKDLHFIDSRSIARLTQKDFLANTIIDVSPAHRDELAMFENHFPVGNSQDILQLQEHLVRQSRNKTSIVYLVNETGDYSRVLDILQLPSPTVFFLQGGRIDYQQFMQQHEASLRPRESRLQTIGGCESCPPEAEDNNQ